MNYCDKIRYHLYRAEKAAFPVMVDELLNQLPDEEVILRLAFFGTPPTNEEYLNRKRIIHEKIHQKFGDKMPTISYVSQPPLDAPLILEAHSYVPETSDKLSFQLYKEIPYVVLENEDMRMLFAGGFQSDVVNQSIQQQSVEVFRLLSEVLEREQFPINSIIRQWNYIEQITRYAGEDQHYQSFNNARSACYQQTTWENGYPAATGIGTNLGGILVDLDAVVFKRSNAYATAIDNKLQIAAHAYSDQVLDVSHKIKSTPKFERAKSITIDQSTLIYISGTAAIRGEESLKNAGFEKQLRATMENIAELTGKAVPVILRVYLRDKEDYADAVWLMDKYDLQIPISYMWADVCRKELLVEIEGIAG
jgi:hypothetical protein